MSPFRFTLYFGSRPNTWKTDDTSSGLSWSLCFVLISSCYYAVMQNWDKLLAQGTAQSTASLNRWHDCRLLSCKTADKWVFCFTFKEWIFFLHLVQSAKNNFGGLLKEVHTPGLSKLTKKTLVIFFFLFLFSYLFCIYFGKFHPQNVLAFDLFVWCSHNFKL